MLPATFSPVGDYSERQLDRARGYRLLAHAEIESFIEDVTLQAAKKKISVWTTNKTPSDLVVCLIAHYHSGFDVDEEGVEPVFPASSRPKVRDEIKEIVDVAFRQYVTIQNNNHGVREKNIKRLILPIGVRRDEIDPTWLTNLDEFGKQRGATAHSSKKAQQQIDPQAELQNVQNLLEGFAKLDVIITALGEQ
ncbi:HEPN domain-containing protein [Chelatococcus sambhunathii]|nr:HEPN domain-containing protein [Chelatococcus sambhunathii]